MGSNSSSVSLLLVAATLATLATLGPVASAKSPRQRLIPVRRNHLARLRPERAANFLSVVRYGTGTGFLVYREPIPGSKHDRGLILTNDHVAGRRKFRKGQLLILGDGTSAYAERLLSSSVASDFALVEIKLSKSSGVQPARLDVRGPHFEQPVYIVGSARNGFDYGSGKMNPRDPHLTGDGEQAVSFASMDGSGSKTSYVHRARLPNRGGMSGSPVVSRRSHRVVGLHCGGGGQTSCLVSMKRVLNELHTSRSIADTDRPLLQRMFSWQENGGRRSVRKTIDRLAEGPKRPRFQKVTKLASPKAVADADNLGSVFFTGEISNANPLGRFSTAGCRTLGIRTRSGELAGFLSYKPQTELRVSGGKATTHESLYVSWLGAHPRYARMGLATKLLDHVKGVARAQNKQSITLDVESDNTAARRLYERHGFRMIGRDDGYHVKMELDLR